MSSRPRGGIGGAALALALALALGSCVPPAVPTAGVQTPGAAESPLAASPAVQPTALASPSATPAPSATPDHFLATIAHIAPAERTDDRTADDADWPFASSQGARQATPEAKTVEQMTTHVVTRGETLSAIANKNGVSVDAIVRANGLDNSTVISVGQRLAIPTGKTTTVTDEYRLAQALEPRFIWPCRAPITTYYNEKGSIWRGGWHSGLDIGANYGVPIVAAEAGLVLEAGWATTRGYGNYVKLDNGLGYHTLYGHMSVIRVKEGQWVNRGDRIGDVGSTGVSTGPHLHFEVRINGNPVDPLPYLPR